jgi:hypothetical protein
MQFNHARFDGEAFDIMLNHLARYPDIGAQRPRPCRRLHRAGVGKGHDRTGRLTTYLPDDPALCLPPPGSGVFYSRACSDEYPEQLGPAKLD